MVAMRTIVAGVNPLQDLDRVALVTTVVILVVDVDVGAEVQLVTVDTVKCRSIIIPTMEVSVMTTTHPDMARSHHSRLIQVITAPVIPTKIVSTPAIDLNLVGNEMTKFTIT
jgi:hypothetical protein